MSSKYRPMLSCCDRLMDYNWFSGEYTRDIAGKRKLKYKGYWMFKCYLCLKEVTV